MILGILGLLGAIFSVTSGAVDIANYLHDHPYAQVEPGSNQWKALCADYFKSFDPDTGWWIDKHGKHHQCVILKRWG